MSTDSASPSSVPATAGAESLPNPRQEMFALHVSSGASQAEAYRRAGYQSQTPEAHAARLAASGSVAERIAFLRGQREGAAIAAATVDAGRIQTELEHVAFSDVGAFFVPDAEGRVMLLPLTEWAEPARRAVSKVKVRRYTEGHGDEAREVEVIELALWPKLEAISQLREHMGLKKDDKTPAEVRVVFEGGAPGAVKDAPSSTPAVQVSFEPRQ